MLQGATSYAVSGDTPEVSEIASEVRVSSGNTGEEYKTSPRLADSIRAAGAATAQGIDKLGVYVGNGIVRAGLWFRKHTAKGEADVQMSPRTLKRYASCRANHLAKSFSRCCLDCQLLASSRVGCRSLTRFNMSLHPP